MSAVHDWRQPPQAVRRTVSERDLCALREQLRGRWFVLGCLTTSVVFALGYYVLPLIGGGL